MTDFTYKTVTSDIERPGVRVLRLNRPECLNAMNRQLIDDLAQATEDANRDPETRVILLTGAGRAFCAGDDRRAHVHPDTEEEARDVVLAIQRVTQALSLGPKPVVGAINGWAVGGGFEWAINCDFPIWANSAKAFFPEVSLNLFVTGGVTSLLPALVGLQKAREMLMLGETYTAADLHALGVAWKTTPDEDLMSTAFETAEKLSALPTLSLRAMKRALNATASTDLTRAMALETEACVAGFMDPETTRLLQAF